MRRGGIDPLRDQRREAGNRRRERRREEEEEEVEVYGRFGDLAQEEVATVALASFRCG